MSFLKGLVPKSRRASRSSQRSSTPTSAPTPTPAPEPSNLIDDGGHQRTEREKQLLKELWNAADSDPYRKFGPSHERLHKLLQLERELRSHSKYEKLFHDCPDRQSVTDDEVLCLDLPLLYKFLVAKRFRYPVARKYIVDWIEWRLKEQPHKITLADVWDVYKSGQAYWNGQDKNGLPLLVLRPHLHSSVKGQFEPNRRFAMWIAEQGARCMRERGDKVRCVVFFDASKMKLRNIDLSMIKAFLDVALMYPEALEYALVIPTPIFRLVWNVWSSFIDPTTREKIKFIKSHKDLLQYFDSDQLEKDLGGTSSFNFFESLKTQESISPC